MFVKSLLIIVIVTFLIPINAYAQNEFSTTESRLAGAQQKQGVFLDDAAKANVINNCQKVQNTLVVSRQNSDKNIQKRIVFYSDVQKELQAIELRMMRQGVDSSEMDLLIGKIQQSLDEFTVKADEYGVVLSDLIIVDCKSKPEQFYGGVVELRQKRAELNSSASKLKDVLADSKSSTFIPLKNRLTTQ